VGETVYDRSAVVYDRSAVVYDRSAVVYDWSAIGYDWTALIYDWSTLEFIKIKKAFLSRINSGMESFFTVQGVLLNGVSRLGLFDTIFIR
jgi:hypothetical protein